MTATHELRRLLNERGVYWHPSAWSGIDETYYEVNGVGFLATEIAGKLKVTVEGYITPAELVDATLGMTDGDSE